jgi:polar amino acid transport system substrate-binding protein
MPTRRLKQGCHGNPSGVSVDFEKASAKPRPRVEIQNIAWTDSFPALQPAESHQLVMTINRERSPEIDFPVPNATLTTQFRKHNSGVRPAEDLNHGQEDRRKIGSHRLLLCTNNLPTPRSSPGDESACVTEVTQQADASSTTSSPFTATAGKPRPTKAVFVPSRTGKLGRGVAKETPSSRRAQRLHPGNLRGGGFDQLTEKYLADEKAAFDELASSDLRSDAE